MSKDIKERTLTFKEWMDALRTPTPTKNKKKYNRKRKHKKEEY